MTNVTPPPSDPSGGTPPQGATPAGQPYGQPQGAPQGQPYGAPQGQQYGAPQGQQYGSTPPYSAPAGGGAPVKQTLSLTSFIVGLANLVLFSWGVPVLGLLGGVAALILALQARKREPNAPSWMWIVGLISGILGIVINLFVTIGLIIALLAFGAAFSTIPTY